MVSNYAHYYWLIYRGCNQPCQSSLTQFCFQGQYTLLKLIVPEPLFPYGRVSLSVIALEWLIQHFVVIPWILLGKSLGSLVGHSVLPNECTETAASRPPIALILSSVLRLVHSIFSTSELNVYLYYHCWCYCGTGAKIFLSLLFLNPPLQTCSWWLAPHQSFIDIYGIPNLCWKQWQNFS